MFERLKNLFKRRPEEVEATDSASETYAPREFRPGYTPGEPIAEPLPPVIEPVEAIEEPPPPATGDYVQIPLRPILLKLPESLKSRVRQPPSTNVLITVPLPKILPQLAQGSVRISFGELRQAAPAGVFSDISDQDHASVELPLPTVLAQLKPEQLPRRASQKKVDVPEEVTSLFGSKGEALTVVRMSTASPPAPVVPGKPAVGPTPAIAPRAAPAPPSAPALRPATVSPDAPIRPASPLPSPAALKPQAPPPTTPSPAVAQPIKPTQPLPAPPAAPRPTVVPPPSAAPAPVAQPSAPAVPTEPLSVPLASIISGWPEGIRQELPSPADAVLLLPADETEQALKRGKISFSWKRLRSWIKPPPLPATAAAMDETMLDLPLPVIAPLFLAHKKPSAPQKKYAITEHIPDVFTGKGLATGPAEATAPAAIAAAPAAAPRSTMPPAAAMPSVAAPAAPAAAAAPPKDIGEVFGQPGRKNWTPSELVQKTSALRGVAGALIAMQDGLVVASHLPPGLNGETIAAFLPQMFSRIMQYSKELKFGETNGFTIIVDNVPLKISKSGGVYFTVIGRSGEALPEPHLSIIAAQLGPQSK